jgi:hypothetical protein
VKQKMPPQNHAHERRSERPAGFAHTFLEKPGPSTRLHKNSNQTCRRKKAGNFPAAASYTFSQRITPPGFSRPAE